MKGLARRLQKLPWQVWAMLGIASLVVSLVAIPYFRVEPGNQKCSALLDALDSELVLGRTEEQVVSKAKVPAGRGIVDEQFLTDHRSPEHGRAPSLGETYLLYGCEIKDWLPNPFSSDWYWDIVLVFDKDGRCVSVFVHA